MNGQQKKAHTEKLTSLTGTILSLSSGAHSFVVVTEHQCSAELKFFAL